MATKSIFKNVNIKTRKSALALLNAMEQSIRDSERMQDGMPALFHRRNRKSWLVTMRLEDWLKFYRTESEQREKPL